MPSIGRMSRSHNVKTFLDQYVGLSLSILIMKQKMETAGDSYTQKKTSEQELKRGNNKMP